MISESFNEEIRSQERLSCFNTLHAKPQVSFLLLTLSLQGAFILSRKVQAFRQYINLPGTDLIIKPYLSFKNHSNHIKQNVTLTKTYISDIYIFMKSIQSWTQTKTQIETVTGYSRLNKWSHHSVFFWNAILNVKFAKNFHQKYCLKDGFYNRSAIAVFRLIKV